MMLAKKEYVKLTDDERTKVIGHILKFLREKANMSQGKVSMETKIPKSTYANYERGVHCPSIETLLQLCYFYDTTMDFITGKSLVAIKDFDGIDIKDLLNNLTADQLTENASKLATMFENISYIKANIIRFNYAMESSPDAKQYLENVYTKLTE